LKIAPRLSVGIMISKMIVLHSQFSSRNIFLLILVPIDEFLIWRVQYLIGGLNLP